MASVCRKQTLREFCLYLQGADSLLTSQACEQEQWLFKKKAAEHGGGAQRSRGGARRASQKRQGWNSSQQGRREKAGTSGVRRECSYHLKALVAQSCSTLCDPMNCSPPGSSVHGILQARILEWVAIPFSRGSSQSNQGLLHCRQLRCHLNHQGMVLMFCFFPLSTSISFPLLLHLPL